MIGGTWHEGNRRGFPISDSPSNCHGYALHNSLKVRVCGPSTPTSKWAGFSAALPIAMARWWYKRKTGNRNHRMHRRWTETPPLWSAGKSPEGCLRRDLLVDGGGAITCVWAAVCPSEKQKRKKLGCHFGWPFWPKDRDRVDLGSGYHCGLTSGSGCGGRRTSLGHGDAGMGGG